MPGSITTPENKSKRRSGSLFERGEIIGWDGEGVNTGRIVADALEHRFTLLANSEGDTLYNAKGITTAQALKFLTDVGRYHPRAIHVFFAGNYDCNCLLRDLTREDVIMLVPERGQPRSKILYKCETGHYRIQWIPRKQLSIWKIQLDEDGRRVTKWKNGRREAVIEAKITLWDIFGFFQGSFVGAIKKWLPGCPDLQIIEQGKAARGEFDSWSREDLERYNAAELRVLVQLVDKVRTALMDLGLSISRWDGAGAVAAAMLKRHNMREYLPPLPELIERAASHAYFGGRIERGQFGTARDVWAYDVNSAYPAVIADLPALNQGAWKRYEFPHGVPIESLRGQLPRFSVVRISWHYKSAARYYPFPWRFQDGRVSFPDSGAGWYWYPEIEAAMDFEKDPSGFYGAFAFEAYGFKETAERPWSWVRDYYHERQKMIAERGPGGAELMLKLGLNSLYGKTAQTAGYNEADGRRPPYHSIAAAGYITSSTRAQLFRAVRTDPEAVIMLATDGVFATRKLAIEVPEGKPLGGWGLTRYAHFVSVASGVYFTRKEGADEWVSMCRGYDRTADQDAILQRLESVITGWESQQRTIYWPSTRFVGAGSAKVSDEQFRRWCSWYAARAEDGTPGRAVQLVPDEFKRVYRPRRAVYPTLAAKRLVWTEPCKGLGSDAMSTNYFLPWAVVEADEELKEIEDCDYD